MTGQTGATGQGAPSGQGAAGRRVSLFHPPGGFGRPGNPFGKDIANVGLFRALARHGDFQQIDVLHHGRIPEETIAGELFHEGPSRTAVATAPLLSTDLPAGSGVLLRGQPYLAQLGWIRRSAGLDRRYSLVGLIHSIAPPGIRETMGLASLAPIHPWDALICTSPCVQEAMQTLFDRWEEHLGQRLGARRLPRPHLPVVPLGVDAEAIAARADSVANRTRLRERHRIGADDHVVLWVGRLSFFEKAFPQPMFLAVEEAARQTDRPVHFVMLGWFPGGDADRDRYIEAAHVHAPSVNLLFLDGNDPDLVAHTWAMADVFLSLVDNIQETFGLTPLEAMAAGLPVVVSDWDGYRFTVRDGQEGFLVPTLGGAPGPLGAMLCHLHALELEPYQAYVGAVAQHTAVHVGAAAASLARLFASAELRARMGAAGRERVRRCFSWSVVVEQYHQLFEELAELRAGAAAGDGEAEAARLNPLRGDPFEEFQGFATEVLRPDTRLRLVAGVTAASQERLRQARLDQAFPILRGTPDEARALLAHLEGQPGLSVADLLGRFPPARGPFLGMTLVWLAKLGLVDWRAE